MRTLLLLISFFLSSHAEADVIYKVKRGDSLLKISRKFHVSIRKIRKVNGIRGNTIYVGQKLRIPLPVKRIQHSKKRKRPEFVPKGLTKVPIYKYYRVRKGDSVLKIAKKFHVSGRSIIRINHLRRPYILRPGQKLKILVGYKDVLKLNRPLQFKFPLDGRVDTTIREEGYPGIFILGEPGTPVKAAETGIVKFAGKDTKFLKAYGNLVIIQHPENYQTIYANLNKIFVKPRQIVKRGEIIGTAGTSGVWKKSGVYFDINRIYNGATYHIQPLEVLK
jgi:murein DD-endopeptidase MepM/ murein hydrolase activator NlpD